MTLRSFKLIPLKRLVRQHSGAIKAGPFGSDLTSHDMQGGPVRVFNQRNVIEKDLTAGDSSITEEKFSQLRSFEVQAGDVLITTRGTIGKILVVPAGAQRGILHPCLIRVQPDERKLDTRYLAWVLQDDEFMQEQVKLLSKSSTIEVIYSDTMASLRVPCPPLTTQTAIANYLDAKTAAIDALIAKKELLIEELKKYTQAVVTETVLRGLNPTAQLALSRAPGMGLIPSHWQVAKTSKVLRYVKGVAVPKEDLATEGDPAHRFLRTGDFWNINGHEKDQAFATKTDGLVWKNEGELVVCFDGFNSVAGKGTVGMARFDGAGYIDSMLCLVKEKEGRSHRRFLEYLHASRYMENQIVVAARGTTAMHAGYAQYDILVPVPPLGEQKAIADALDARLAPLRPIAESAVAQLRELRLLRAALIAEAITGKLQLPA